MKKRRFSDGKKNIDMLKNTIKIKAFQNSETLEHKIGYKGKTIKLSGLVLTNLETVDLLKYLLSFLRTLAKKESLNHTSVFCGWIAIRNVLPVLFSDGRFYKICNCFYIEVSFEKFLTAS